jgi:hypothetical protein
MPATVMLNAQGDGQIECRAFFLDGRWCPKNAQVHVG